MDFDRVNFFALTSAVLFIYIDFDRVDSFHILVLFAEIFLSKFENENPGSFDLE